jgi:hypothetical protein
MFIHPWLSNFISLLFPINIMMLLLVGISFIVEACIAAETAGRQTKQQHYQGLEKQAL